MSAVRHCSALGCATDGLAVRSARRRCASRAPCCAQRPCERCDAVRCCCAFGGRCCQCTAARSRVLWRALPDAEVAQRRCVARARCMRYVAEAGARITWFSSSPSCMPIVRQPSCPSLGPHNASLTAQRQHVCARHASLGWSAERALKGPHASCDARRHCCRCAEGAGARLQEQHRTMRSQAGSVEQVTRRCRRSNAGQRNSAVRTNPRPCSSPVDRPVAPPLNFGANQPRWWRV